jgi:O-antigen/teichoic acid export membrane protein
MSDRRFAWLRPLRNNSKPHSRAGIGDGIQYMHEEKNLDEVSMEGSGHFQQTLRMARLFRLKTKLLRRRLSSDSWRTFWAIADQCTVSGGNFLTNLILIRSLLPIEFGTYALMLSSMIFFNSIQQAFVSYPVCVRGARANPRQLRRILSFAIFVTILLLVGLFGPALAFVAASLHRPKVILAAITAMLFWQLQDTLRTGFTAKLEQRRALIGDGISYAGQVMLLAMICLRTRPSLNLIFWTIAGTSLLAFACQSWQIRPSVPARRALRPLLQEFWFLGRWNLVAKVLGFLTLQAFPWVILMRHGAVEVAAYQAIFQILALSNPLLFSIGSLIMATVAKDKDYRTSSVRKYLFAVTTVMCGYLLLLGVAGSFVMRLMYGSSTHYLGYAPLLRIFAAAWLFEMIALLAVAILGGLRQPRALFLVQLSGAVAAVLIALPWIYWKGLIAAAFGMLLVNAVRAGTGVLLILLARGEPGRGMELHTPEPAVVYTSQPALSAIDA